MRELANERPAANRAARRAETNRILSNVKKRLKNPQLLNQARDGLFKQLQRDLDEVGILSLSAENDHVLMWSHYADYHKGICLRFKAKGSFGEAHRVRYVPERRPIDLLHRDREALVDAVLTKAEFWRYEQEWRIVDPYNGPGSRGFAPELLDAVILGANIRDEDEAMVREWVAKRPIAFLRARIDDERYRMKIIPIE